MVIDFKYNDETKEYEYKGHKVATDKGLFKIINANGATICVRTSLLDCVEKINELVRDGRNTLDSDKLALEKGYAHQLLELLKSIGELDFYKANKCVKHIKPEHKIVVTMSFDAANGFVQDWLMLNFDWDNMDFSRIPQTRNQLEWVTTPGIIIDSKNDKISILNGNNVRTDKLLLFLTEEGCKITIPLLKLLFPKVGKIIDGMSQLDSNKIRLVINGKSPNYKGELDFATQED